MHLYYTLSDQPGALDACLVTASQALTKSGIELAGTIQINRDNATGPCDMDVVVLPAGPRICISQSLGASAKGCRLDPEGLEKAVGLVGSSLQAGPDCLFINKFGKHEADGRGFRTLIADAIALGVPVIVGVNALNLSAFLEFAGELAVFVEPTTEAICRVVKDACSTRADAA